jgi:enamine deaminase RidA (YjgF/YER057c/UK114 family)
MSDNPTQKVNNSRRRLLSKGAAAVAVFAGAQTSVKAAETAPTKKVHYKGAKPAKPGLFSGAVSYGNLLFIAGKGAHYEGDVKAHTKTVLDEIEAELVNAGSSMDKVLKANVYLAKAEDYAAMNEMFKGRFGAEPPVRTTIAAAWVPGNSLVEIDVIAYI